MIEETRVSAVAAARSTRSMVVGCALVARRRRSWNLANVVILRRTTLFGAYDGGVLARSSASRTILSPAPAAAAAPLEDPQRNARSFRPAIERPITFGGMIDPA